MGWVWEGRSPSQPSLTASLPQQAGDEIPEPGLPRPLDARRLQEACRTALADPEFPERLSTLGVEPPEDGSAAALAQRIRTEAVQWREAIRISGASID